jgi:GNAT superfamily N-acetyltransferase
MITFRKAVLTDIPELVRLRIEFISKINNASECSLDLSKELFNYFKQSMEEGTFVAWLASDNENLIATSGICFYTVPPTFSNLTGRTSYIMNMYTLEQYRKQGIASKLFDRVIEEAKSRGCKKIYLHATENGRPLYKKFGFKETDNEMTYSL